MQSLKKFFQPYRFSNRPYQSLPQMVFALTGAAIAIVGLFTLNGWLIVPGAMVVAALELSALPQERHWRERTINK